MAFRFHWRGGWKPRTHHLNFVRDSFSSSLERPEGSLSTVPHRAIWRIFRAAGDRPQVRRYLYAIGEVAGVALVGFAYSVVFMDRSYRIGHGDPGMAKITGVCMLIIGAGFFALAYCAKAMDRKVLDLIYRVTQIETRIQD